MPLLIIRSIFGLGLEFGSSTSLKKIKCLFWLACHNLAPILSLLHHRNLKPSTFCNRCRVDEETFLHWVQDCYHSKNLWLNLWLHLSRFFSAQHRCTWLRIGISGSQINLFAASIWGTWRNCNATCFANETTALYRLSLAARFLSETIYFLLFHQHI